MPGDPVDDAPSPEFTDECERFLARRYPRRSAPTPHTAAWGVGSDRAAVWEEADQAADRARIEQVRAWRRALWDHNLGWLMGPAELGGRGLSAAHQRAFDAAARSFDVPGNAKLVVSLGIVAPTVQAHGTDEVRRTLLPGLFRGDLIACQLFSEPGAGSDLAGIAARAVPDGTEWRITGQKVWTSGAHYSDIGLMLCKTSDGPRHRNLTAFVVDLHARGVDVRPLRQMTGGAAFNEVFLDDVRVSDTYRLGPVDDGWRVALTALSHERAALGGEGFGGNGLLRIDRYAQLARAMNVSDDALVRDELAALFIEFLVAQQTRSRVINAAKQGRPPGPEASIGKMQLVRNYGRIANFVTRVLGPMLTADTGEWGTYAWAEFVLGAPGVRIGGGTDEVQKNILAERVLGLPKS